MNFNRLFNFLSQILALSLVATPFVVSSQNITYGTLYNNTTFNNKSVNITLPVGSTGAVANVGSMGNATYTIPIAMPPGTNSVVPTLAINYNSMGSNGMLGQGWSLSGLSAIFRVPLSIYFDTYANAVELNSNDRFAFDGVRLLSTSGVYGANGTTYATESESFATITSNGNMGGGPLWFEVWTKDGMKMEFGNTSDSRLLNHDNTVVLSWKLNKIKYNDGNYIEFKYTNTDNDHRIDEINYTGNSVTGQLPYNKVKFNYGVRYDVTTNYEAKTPLVSKYLINNITITGESGLD